VSEPAPVPVSEPAPVPVSEPAPVPVSEPAPVPEPEPEPEPEPVGRTDVDALFARIRASRAAAVADARRVLDAAEAPAADGAFEPAADPVTAPSQEPLADPAAGRDRDGALAWLEAAAAEPGTGDVADAPTGAPDGPHARRDELVAPVDVDLDRAVKRALADELNRVLGAVRATEGELDVLAALGDEGEQRERYAVAVVDAVCAAASVGATLVLGTADRADLGPSFAPDAVIDAIAEELLGQVRNRVGRVLDERPGEPDAQQERLRALYREVRQERVAGVVRHAVDRAVGAGAATVLEPGAPVTWSMTPGAPCSPDCEDNALAGPTPFGELFPAGDIHPPRHPGCRCLLVPVDR
jgi:hypothetical protein